MISDIQVIPTGIPNLDHVLGGGLPLYSCSIVAGKPGTGKTILAQQVLIEGMVKPTRLVIDSLWPLAAPLEQRKFVDLVHRKNLMLRRPDMAMLDTKLDRTLDAANQARLLNAYDVVVELIPPEWGKEPPADGARSGTLRILKARGAEIHRRSHPYTITPRSGVAVQRNGPGT